MLEVDVPATPANRIDTTTSKINTLVHRLLVGETAPYITCIILDSVIVCK
jgi:hypothetical protein